MSSQTRFCDYCLGTRDIVHFVNLGRGRAIPGGDDLFVLHCIYCRLIWRTPNYRWIFKAQNRFWNDHIAAVEAKRKVRDESVEFIDKWVDAAYAGAIELPLSLQDEVKRWAIHILSPAFTEQCKPKSFAKLILAPGSAVARSSSPTQSIVEIGLHNPEHTEIDIASTLRIEVSKQKQTPATVMETTAPVPFTKDNASNTDLATTMPAFLTATASTALMDKSAATPSVVGVNTTPVSPRTHHPLRKIVAVEQETSPSPKPTTPLAEVSQAHEEKRSKGRAVTSKASSRPEYDRFMRLIKVLPEFLTKDKEREQFSKQMADKVQELMKQHVEELEERSLKLKRKMAELD